MRVQGAIGACGAPLVGLTAERIFGFKGMASGQGAAIGGRGGSLACCPGFGTLASCPSCLFLPMPRKRLMGHVCVCR